MAGRLNDILPEPLSEANEAAIMDLLKRKMSVCLGLAVQVLRAMESRFGPEVRQVALELAERQSFPLRESAGDPRVDLRDFCVMLEHAAAGSCQWDKVLDESDRVSYRFTRCLFAELLREMGEPELGRVICARDEPWVQSYHPVLGLERRQTLMQGDPVCDTTFVVRPGSAYASEEE